MSIKVSKVSKFYGSQKALNEISFEIGSGEIVGFIGPNGAGKSTMMKIICGYLSPSEGEVSVNGFDIVEQSIDVRRNIGYLPEHNPLYLEMYVKEFLEFSGKVYNVTNIKDKVENIIERTGLTKEQHKKIGQLSKGYRQRVGLAHALIHEPAVLILDEPTTGLDPNQIVEIRNLISEVGKSKTVMLSTHIMQEVEAICDRVIIINKGEIVADGKAGNIRHESAKNEFVVLVEFLNDCIVEQVNEIKGVDAVKQLSAKSWILTNLNGEDIRENIFNYAVKSGLTVLSMQKQEVNLEEAFQKLTK